MFKIWTILSEVPKKVIVDNISWYEKHRVKQKELGEFEEKEEKINDK